LRRRGGGETTVKIWQFDDAVTGHSSLVARDPMYKAFFVSYINHL
jgi:hypothetical protein